MKVGDKVVLIIHGAGVVSKEDGYIIEGISDKILTLENEDKVFYKKKDGSYRTEKGFGNFWFEIKGK